MIQTLLSIETFPAVDRALRWAVILLHMDHEDNLGFRNIVPPLLLRLGRIQSCYDFCSWWATEAQAYHTFPEDDRPFLDFSTSNPYDALLPELISEDGNLSHVVSMTLLKIQLFLGTRALRSWTILLGTIPLEILHMIRLHGIQDTPASTAINAYNIPNDTRVIKTLQSQIKQLFRVVNNMNESFWSALSTPDKHMARELVATPEIPEEEPYLEDYESEEYGSGEYGSEEHEAEEYESGDESLPQPGEHSFLNPEQSSRGTTEEIEVVLRHNYRAWVETPGAIDVIRVLLSRD